MMRFFFSLIFCCVVGGLMAQEIVITNGTVQTCGGVFVDDGVEGSYTDTDYVFTICPDNPGDVISVEFTAFSVQTSGNPNNSDYLSVFDGDNPGELSLGSYSGTDLTGLVATGTVDNVTGCLTFVFTCGTGNTGAFPGWIGEINCTTPCSTPTMASEIANPPSDFDDIESIGVCAGEEITFVDAGSTAGPGFTLENYIWNFDDGNIVTTTDGEVVHTYTDPGEYIVTLTVEDNNGCQSVNVIPMQVLVSTIPIFNTVFDEQVCLGGTGSLDGAAIESTTWTAIPPTSVADETYLADDLGFIFPSPIVVDFFEDGQVLENCEDLLSIGVNIEHSYLGDLSISIECPDGTEVDLLTYPNGGGNTWLGEPVDFEDSTTPGTGYDYGWSATSTLGFIDDDDNNEVVSFTDNDGNNMNNEVANPGIYQAEGDLCDLVGCPLNGTWTILIQDNIGFDDGNLFTWNLNINPDLYPDVTTFTPEIGLDIDSTYWEGPHIISTSISDDGNYIEIEPTDLGPLEYTFFSTNNFGCTFDTTIVVDVVSGPVIDAGPNVCSIDGLQPFIADNQYQIDPCEFSVFMTNTQGDDWGWGAASIDFLVDGEVVGNYSPSGWPLVNEFAVPIVSGAQVEIVYNEDMWGGTGNFFTLFDDAGNELWTSPVDPAGGVVYTFMANCQGPGQIVWEWSPADGLSDTSVPVPDIDADALATATTYTLTVYPEEFPGCATSDEVVVSPPFDYTFTSGEDQCDGTPAFVAVDIDENTGVAPWTLDVFLDGNLSDSGTTDGEYAEFSGIDPGSYVVEISNGFCTLQSDVVINPAILPELTVSNDTTICLGGTANLQAVSPSDPGLVYTYVWDNGLTDGSTQSVSPGTTTAYSVFTVDEDGCQSQPENILVAYFDPLQVTAPTDVTVCPNADVDLQTQLATGANGLGYAYEWTFNGDVVGNTDGLVVQPVTNGTYCVTLTAACESPAVQDCFDVTLEAPIPVLVSADTTGGCFPASFNLEVGLDPSEYALAEWLVSDGTAAFNQHTLFVAPESQGSYDVALTLTSLAGCVYTDTLEDYLSVYSNPVASFDAGPQPTLLPATELTFVDLSVGDVTEWYWEFDTNNLLGTSTVQNPVFTFPTTQGGIYPVSLTVTDSNGCMHEITREVEITDVFALYVPNAFTPNNDGINDVFQVWGSDLDEDRFELQVFNRWGELVFETQDINTPWIGNYTDQGAHYVPDGVYAWRVVAHSRTTTDKIERTGSVTIVR